MLPTRNNTEKNRSDSRTFVFHTSKWFPGFRQSCIVFNSSVINTYKWTGRHFGLRTLKKPKTLRIGGYKGKCMYHGRPQLLNNTQLARKRSNNNFMFLFIVLFFLKGLFDSF